MNKEVLHILLLLLYCIFIILTTLLIYVYTYINHDLTYNLLRRKQNLLLITTIGILLIGSLEIYINGFDKVGVKYKIIKLNFYYIFVTPCFFAFCYRGVYIYIEHMLNVNTLSYNNNKTINLKIKKYLFFTKIIFCFLYLLIIFYIIIFDLLYKYNFLKNIEIGFYPYHLVTFIDLIMHPINIYLLYKIKNTLMYDYIVTMIIMVLYFIIISDIYVFNFDIIEKYPGAILGGLCYIEYLIVPFVIKLINNTKYKNMKKEENVIELDLIENKINKKITKICIEYKNIKKDEKQKLMKFFENNIETIKTYYSDIDKNNSIIYKIEQITETKKENEYDLCKINHLFEKIYEDTLIKIYENI